MKWSDVTGFLGDAAPVIGTLVGGPAGAAVGGLIAKALGVEDKPDAVIDALKSNPEALLKIKELEYSKEIKEIETNLEKYRIDADLKKEKINESKTIDQNTTERWLSDNVAGGLPAITRPLIVWWLIVSFTLMALADGNMEGFAIKAIYLEILQSLLLVSVPAYMGLRTWEKQKGVA